MYCNLYYVIERYYINVIVHRVIARVSSRVQGIQLGRQTFVEKGLNLNIVEQNADIFFAVAD